MSTGYLETQSPQVIRGRIFSLWLGKSRNWEVTCGCHNRQAALKQVRNPKTSAS